MSKQQIELNPQFKQALKYIKSREENLFITGKAGTGKSTLLDYFRTQSKKKPVVLAPTGVAALNVKGQTIHSFFNFPISVTPESIQKQKRRPKNPATYKKLRILIIDEVSMLRADLMDCIDVFLRKFGPHKGRPFGGVRMIFFGDLYQLPPVISSGERGLFSSHYKSPFFFSAHVFENFSLKILELEKIYRQKDSRFTDLLNRIRNNTAEDQDIKTLNRRHLPSFKPKAGTFYITLSARNKTADMINQEQLEKLKGRCYSSTAALEGDFKKEHFPTSLVLKYKIGTQIMLLNNDSQRRWVNGTLGIIEDVDTEKEYISVRLTDSNQTVFVTRHNWELYKFSYSEKQKSMVVEPIGAFNQYPFRLAWAVTIHKSQGKSFDRVIIDLSGGLFACGQAYVALSRCRSLEGIVLKSPLKKHHIKTDYRIFPFLTGLQYKESESEMPFEEKVQKVQAAINEGKKLEISYLKANNIKSLRTVRPISTGMQSYKGTEYQGMMAFCESVQDERAFRIDRILSLKVL